MSDFIVNSFQLPNSVVDELLADLTGAELKCYLLVVRKTKGWNKEIDSISIGQFMEVTGLSNRSVITACDSLVEKGLLVRSGGERRLNTYSVKSFNIPQTGEKSSSDKTGENISQTGEKSSSDKTGENISQTGEKSSSNLVKKVHTQNNNKNTIQNNNTSSSGKFSQTRAKARKNVFSDDDLMAAEWILGLIRKLNPSFKEPKIESWANDIRLMRERDNRTHKDICELFKWANQDRFWSVNILSPATLRAKWDQLSMKRNAAMIMPTRKETFQERNSTNWGTAEKMAEVF